ncbi:PAS domain S-box protein [Candidatus Clostridium stratigraminis]|uniref:PAS domain S-box protein n=1 Tax=Candidatus Clostridium stratigraminis TaxID=3381661 RepID=A0ABW8SYD5_9CLOT
MKAANSYNELKEYDLNVIMETSNFNYAVLLNGILKGITDIIGVYKPDGTIMFYNDVGYAFFNTTHEQVVGKKCFESLGRSCRCKVCTTEMALKTRSLVRIEKYIPELDKYMDCRCNPVIDRDGKVVLVVEQLRDITERRKLENAVKESEERYKKIVELSPDGIVIISEDKVVLANNAAAKILGQSIEEIINKDVAQYVAPDYIHILKERMKQILEKEISINQFDYKLLNLDGSTIDIQVSSSFLIHGGKPSIQCVLRNITDFKKQLNNASKIQRQSLIKEFPIANKALMETIYLPAKTVSGDNYCIYEINENFAIGIIYDVSGKGITAALNVSAFNVLFNEAIIKYKNPMDILVYLNQKASDYLGENYVAANCFSFDFIRKEAVIVGAGVSRFAFSKKNQYLKEKIVKGAFIGMFPNSKFDEMRISFDKGDRFCFFTDGFDELFDSKDGILNLPNAETLEKLKQEIDNNLLSKSLIVENVMDDCTLLAIEII